VNLGSAIGQLARRREYGVLALLLVAVATVTAVNPTFLERDNLRNVLVQCAPTAIVACGLTLVIVTREIDISVGSMMGLLAAVMGILTSPRHTGMPVAAGIALTLLLGAAIGLLNGVLVTFGRVPSIIVTLGMLTALRGLTEWLMGGEWITDLPAGLKFFGTGSVLLIPLSLWVAAAVIVCSIVLARRTRLGLRIYAVGGNPLAARMAGLSIRRAKIFVFALTGFLTAIATLVSVTQLSVIESGIGVEFEMLVVTCVVVGGASISGGRGTIAGSLLAVLLLGTVRTFLIFLRLGEMSTYWERAIQGAFILGAVLLDHLARRRTSRES
jgi:ribose/xylose/arabinose/galactoside ABC-type transport system permease subunit